MLSANAKGLGFCLLLLGGCAVGPDYQAPELVKELPQAWHAPLPHGGESDALAQWWRQFDDPLLTTLIESAEANNPTVAGAVASVEEARAAVRGARAGYWPALTAKGSVIRSSGSTSSTGADAATISTAPIENESATLDAAWEIDLFGKTRRGVQGKKARLQASEWSWHDARVSLAAEVAIAYTNGRQCEQLVKLYSTDLDSRRETGRLTALKLNAGFTAPADVARTEASVAESESTLENQKGLCKRYQNQLVALTGLSYESLTERLVENPAKIPLPPVMTVTTVPAQLISQRPDVASSERSLAATSAEIGVAVADRLPALTLTGSIGANTTRIADFTDSSKTWSFGPALSLPIFDAGRRSAAVDAARARYDQALSQYRQAVISAVQEVEDALVRVDTSARRLNAAEIAARRYADYFYSIDQKYRHGAASVLELEEARRVTLTNQQTLVSVQLEMSQSWIALYKAAGGGWQASNDQTSAPEAAKPETTNQEMNNQVNSVPSPDQAGVAQ